MLRFYSGGYTQKELERLHDLVMHSIYSLRKTVCDRKCKTCDCKNICKDMSKLQFRLSWEIQNKK